MLPYTSDTSHVSCIMYGRQQYAAPVCFDVPVQWSPVFSIVETSGVVSKNQRWHFTGSHGSRRANRNFTRFNKLVSSKRKLAPQRNTTIIVQPTVFSVELGETVYLTLGVSFNVTAVSD